MGLSINVATGQNAEGVIQTSGDLPDANWTVSNANTYKDAPIAYTVAPGDSDWYGLWLGNNSSSSWIAANPDNLYGNGDMIFTLKFNLTGYNAADASLVGGLATLDDIGDVLLNGHEIGSVAYNTFNSLHTLSSGAGDFVSGWNTLTIQITESDNLYEGGRLQGMVVDNVPSSPPIHWANAVSGNFRTATDWQGGVVPTSTSDAILDAAGGNYTVTSSVDETANSVQLAANATLLVTGGTFTATAGTGSGANAGTISVHTGTFVASGTVENAGGTIFADTGGIVDLSGATLVGGTLSTKFSGVIDAGGPLGGSNPGPGTFDGTTSGIVNLGTVVVQDGYGLIIKGSIENDFSISLASTGDATELEIGQGGATLSGSGYFNLSDNANNAISAASPDAVLTVASIIDGAGTIGGGGLGLDNEGLVDANGTNALILSTSAPVTNTGVFEGAAAGGLTISGTSIDNAGGTIQAGYGSQVDLSASTIAGGTLKTQSTGAIYVSGTGSTTFDGSASALTIEASVVVRDGGELNLLGPVDNSGTISVEGQTTETSLDVGKGGATLSGGGSIVLSDNADNTIAASSSGAMLTNTDNTISGAGSIGGGGLGLANDTAGTIDANGTNALIVSTTGAVTNAGLIEATGSGGLSISATIDNAGGTISAAAGSGINLSGATIAGGTLTTVGSGVINVSGSPTTFDGTTTDVVDQASIVVQNGSQLILKGAIQNSGTISLQGQTKGSSLTIGQGGATLSGGGSITLSDLANDSITAAASGAVLTNVDNTISGTGTIGAGGLGFTNESAGTLDATGNALTLSTTGAVSNAGTLEATGAGSSLIIENTTIDNAGGTISVGAGARLFLESADIQGGALAGAATGGIRVLGAANMLDGTASTVDISGRMVVASTASLSGQGSIDNSGAITVQGTATLNGPLDNTGRIAVAGGALTIEGAVSGAGKAVIDGGTLTFASSFGEDVAFNGGGTLVLADSQDYGGTIARFSTTGANALDLSDIGFVGPDQATFSGGAAGGVLTVTDGMHTAHIKLLGDYLNSTFTTATDNHGGVIVTDPRVSRLIEAVAASPALSGAGASSREAPQIHEAAVLAPAAQHFG
jgi:hypothetical protein